MAKTGLVLTLAAMLSAAGVVAAERPMSTPPERPMSKAPAGPAPMAAQPAAPARCQAGSSGTVDGATGENCGAAAVAEHMAQAPAAAAVVMRSMFELMTLAAERAQQTARGLASGGRQN